MLILFDDMLDDVPNIDYNKDDYTDSKAYIKFYTTENSFAWYILECNEKDSLYCIAANESSFDFVFTSMSEIENMVLEFGLIVVCDFLFKPTPLLEIDDLYKFMSEEELKEALVRPKNKSAMLF